MTNQTNPEETDNVRVRLIALETLQSLSGGEEWQVQELERTLTLPDDRKEQEYA